MPVMKTMLLFFFTKLACTKDQMMKSLHLIFKHENSKSVTLTLRSWAGVWIVLITTLYEYLSSYQISTKYIRIMHQSFLIPARRPPLLRGWAGDSGANMWGNDLLSSPAVTGKCRVFDITQIYPRGIYSYKEQDYTSQHVPAVQSF